MTVKMRTPSTLGFAAALASAVVPHAYAARTPDSPPPLAPESGYTPGAPDELEPWTKLDSRVPNLFAQERVGLGGRRFRLFLLKTIPAVLSGRGAY